MGNLSERTLANMDTVLEETCHGFVNGGDHELRRYIAEQLKLNAEQDRNQTAPDIAVKRGDVLFAHPKSIQNAIEHALKPGNDPKTCGAKPGEVMGYLAHGHPVLDGNGRTIMVIHSILAQRAGFSIDWAATDKTEYLQALTKDWTIPARESSTSTLSQISVRRSPTSNSISTQPQASMAARAKRILFEEATTILPSKPNTRCNRSNATSRQPRRPKLIGKLRSLVQTVSTQEAFSPWEQLIWQLEACGISAMHARPPAASIFTLHCGGSTW